MIYTSEQIKTAQLKNIAHLEEVNLIKSDILNGAYSMVDACRLASSHNMYPATYGKLIENLTKHIFGLSNPKNESYGDASLYGTVGIEIKASFTRQDGTLGLRQIRFRENIDYFLIVNYDDYNAPITSPIKSSADFFTIHEAAPAGVNMGRVQYYLVPREEMQYLVKKFGNLTHGTINNLGRTTTEDVQIEGKEFSLSYNEHTADTNTPFIIWDYLQVFSYSESELNETLQEIYCAETNGLFEI